MILLTLAILLLILGGVIFFITRPLIKNTDTLLLESKIDSVAIKTEYQIVLYRIRELKQELQDGKINNDDYQERRNKLNIEAAEYLRRLQSQE